MADETRDLAEFCNRVYLPQLADKNLKSEPNHVAAAARHLARFLNRPPTFDDMTTGTLLELCLWLLQSGLAAGTVDRHREVLTRVANVLAGQGLLESLPSVPKFRRRWNRPATKPWSPRQLTQLFGSARTMHGDIDGIPAGTWWTSLLLAVIDSNLSATELLLLPPAAFHSESKTLAARDLIYGVHDKTAAAIAAMATSGRERLFPWPEDGGKPPFFMLYYHFRYVLKRAGLPTRGPYLFDRLRRTGADDPAIIERVNLAAEFTARDLSDYHPRLRNRDERKPRPRSDAAMPATGRPKQKSKRPRNAGPVIHQIAALNPDRTLLRFFNSIYVARRLTDRPKCTATTYRTTINNLCRFRACQVTLEQLSDELIESFLAWLAQIGRAPATRKRALGELCSIWRYAWRKGYVETQPRSIDPIKLAKTIPEAWSVDEVGRLLNAAAAVPGFVDGVLAGLWWQSLILLIYDTGIRISAVMELRVEDVDFDRQHVFVRAETQKQKADQVLPLHPDTVQLLLATNPQQRKHLFPWPFASRCGTLTPRLRKLLQLAGLRATKRDLFHKLRRTNGTYVCDAAGEQAAMRQLGHSALNVTRRYIDTRKLSITRVVDDMQRPTTPCAPSGDRPPRLEFLPADAPPVRLLSEERSA